jgi:hypothetical protein
MKILFIVIIFFSVLNVNGQSVDNTSYITQTGEKVLRLEVILPVDIKEAWNLFTDDNQLKRWIAPLAHIELKNGGYIITNYDETKSLTDSTAIKLNIINYIQDEMITLKVNLNNDFPGNIKEEDQNLQEIIQLVYIEPKKTKIISSMLGWGQGEDWEKTYRFFEKGNIWTYEEMKKLFQ